MNVIQAILNQSALATSKTQKKAEAVKHLLPQQQTYDQIPMKSSYNILNTIAPNKDPP